MTSTTPDDATPAGGTFDANRPFTTRDGRQVSDLRKETDKDGSRWWYKGRVDKDVHDISWWPSGHYVGGQEHSRDLVNVPVAPVLPTAESEAGESESVMPGPRLVAESQPVHWGDTTLALHGAAAASGAVGDIDGRPAMPEGWSATLPGPGPSVRAAIPATPTGATQPSPAAGGGEVAWQVRYKGQSEWNKVVSYDRGWADRRVYNGHEIRPLYAHPAPHAGEAVGRRDGMLRAVEIVKAFPYRKLASEVERVATTDLICAELERTIRAEADRPTDAHDARGTSAEREGAGRDDVDAAVGVTDAEIKAGCDAFWAHGKSNHVYMQVRAIIEAAARARPTSAAGAVTEAAIRADEREACAYLAEIHTGLWDAATAEAIAESIRTGTGTDTPAAGKTGDGVEKLASSSVGIGLRRAADIVAEALEEYSSKTSGVENDSHAIAFVRAYNAIAKEANKYPPPHTMPAAGAVTEAVRAEREAIAAHCDERAGRARKETETASTDGDHRAFIARANAFEGVACWVRRRALTPDPSTKAETPGGVAADGGRG